LVVCTNRRCRGQCDEVLPDHSDGQGARLAPDSRPPPVWSIHVKYSASCALQPCKARMLPSFVGGVKRPMAARAHAVSPVRNGRVVCSPWLTQAARTAERARQWECRNITSRHRTWKWMRLVQPRKRCVLQPAAELAIGRCGAPGSSHTRPLRSQPPAVGKKKTRPVTDARPSRAVCRECAH
jgi:hypothetical protein